MSVETIGFVGLGAMGVPMATVLRRSGASVIGYDVRAEVVSQLAAECVIEPASSARDLAQRCDVVVTMLPTSAHLDDVLFRGEEAAAPSMRPGTLLIDMSSGEPAATRRIFEQLAPRGVQMVDAPVSGNVGRAHKGDLAIMLGGDDDACARAEPVLAPLARAIFRTGPLGSGQAMKALNNLASAAGFWIAAEVLTIGKKAGLDPAVMLQVLNASTGSNNSTQNKFGPFVLSGSYQGNFLLQLMVKDLRIAASLARDNAVPAPMATLVVQQWGEALAALGAGADHTEVARIVAQRAGINLSTNPQQTSE